MRDKILQRHYPHVLESLEKAYKRHPASLKAAIKKVEEIDQKFFVDYYFLHVGWGPENNRKTNYEGLILEPFLLDLAHSFIPNLPQPRNLLAFAKFIPELLMAILVKAPYATELNSGVVHDDWIALCNTVLCTAHVALQHIRPQDPSHTTMHSDPLADFLLVAWESRTALERLPEYFLRRIDIIAEMIHQIKKNKPNIHPDDLTEDLLHSPQLQDLKHLGPGIPLILNNFGEIDDLHQTFPCLIHYMDEHDSIDELLLVYNKLFYFMSEAALKIEFEKQLKQSIPQAELNLLYKTLVPNPSLQPHALHYPDLLLVLMARHPIPFFTPKKIVEAVNQLNKAVVRFNKINRHFETFTYDSPVQFFTVLPLDEREILRKAFIYKMLDSENFTRLPKLTTEYASFEALIAEDANGTDLIDRLYPDKSELTTNDEKKLNWLFSVFPLIKNEVTSADMTDDCLHIAEVLFDGLQADQKKFFIEEYLKPDSSMHQSLLTLSKLPDFIELPPEIYPDLFILLAYEFKTMRHLQAPISRDFHGMAVSCTNLLPLLEHVNGYLTGLNPSSGTLRSIIHSFSPRSRAATLNIAKTQAFVVASQDPSSLANLKRDIDELDHLHSSVASDAPTIPVITQALAFQMHGNNNEDALSDSHSGSGLTEDAAKALEEEELKRKERMLSAQKKFQVVKNFYSNNEDNILINWLDNSLAAHFESLFTGISTVISELVPRAVMTTADKIVRCINVSMCAFPLPFLEIIGAIITDKIQSNLDNTQIKLFQQMAIQIGAANEKVLLQFELRAYIIKKYHNEILTHVKSQPAANQRETFELIADGLKSALSVSIMGSLTNKVVTRGGEIAKAEIARSLAVDFMDKFNNLKVIYEKPPEKTLLEYLDNAQTSIKAII